MTCSRSRGWPASPADGASVAIANRRRNGRSRPPQGSGGTFTADENEAGIISAPQPLEQAPSAVGPTRSTGRLRKMEAFLSKASSVCDSIGETSVRAIGGVVGNLGTQAATGSDSGSEAGAPTRTQSSGNRGGDQGDEEQASSTSWARGVSMNSWLNRQAAAEHQPLVGAPGGDPSPSGLPRFTSFRPQLLSSCSASELFNSSSEVLGRVRSGIESTATTAASSATDVMSRARDSSAALASSAVSKAREGSVALNLAGIPVPGAFGSGPEPPPDPACALCNRYCPCPKLSYSTRLMGFAVCFLLGFILSLSSLMSFTQLLLGNPRPFATKYTLGNAISIASSMCVPPAGGRWGGKERGGLELRRAGDSSIRAPMRVPRQVRDGPHDPVQQHVPP